jgi:hypothetical protein
VGPWGQISEASLQPVNERSTISQGPLHSRCRRLIETLPALQHDPNRPEDVLKVDADEDGVGGDDCADCLRYLVGTKARTLVKRRLTGW